MKSQNDMIFIIASVVLMLIFGTVFFFTKPTPAKPADPERVVLTAPQFTPGVVVYSDSLGGGQGSPGAPAAAGPVGGGNLGSIKTGGAAGRLPAKPTPSKANG